MGRYLDQASLQELLDQVLLGNEDSARKLDCYFDMATRTGDISDQVLKQLQSTRRLLKQQADSGNSWAMAILGQWYQYGQPSAANLSMMRAVRLYKASAALNNPIGQACLGLLYIEGTSLWAKRDRIKALDLLSKSTAQGCWAGMRGMGLLAEAEHRPQEKEEWYRKAALLGDRIALGKLIHPSYGYPLNTYLPRHKDIRISVTAVSDLVKRSNKFSGNSWVKPQIVKHEAVLEYVGEHEIGVRTLVKSTIPNSFPVFIKDADIRRRASRFADYTWRKLACALVCFPYWITFMVPRICVDTDTCCRNDLHAVAIHRDLASRMVWTMWELTLVDMMREADDIIDQRLLHIEKEKLEILQQSAAVIAQPITRFTVAADGTRMISVTRAELAVLMECNRSTPTASSSVL